MDESGALPPEQLKDNKVSLSDAPPWRYFEMMWQKFKWPMMIPILGFCTILGVVFTNQSPSRIEWSGVSLISPVHSQSVYRVDDKAYFQAQPGADVFASITGIVSNVNASARVLDIVSNTGPVIRVQYYDLHSIGVENMQRVIAGDVIGRMNLDALDTPRLRLNLSRLIPEGKSEALQPPFDYRFSEPHRNAKFILASTCNGCHELREVTPFSSGLMLNGQSITRKAIEESLRKGGKKHGKFGMPAFDKDSLPDAEMKDIVEYLCSSKCIPDEDAKANWPTPTELSALAADHRKGHH